MMRTILDVHFPEVSADLIEAAIDTFFRLRRLEGVEKRPATRELINWIRALQSDPDFKPKQLAKGHPPFLGVLFKKSQDLAAAAQAVLRSARH
jgi:hypothetical protein